ncbi:Zinc finger CCCH-type [Pyrenophora seminiperda CCB06]|uniref:Zinc finger CCCH-type n=1 Tax=Pyrenophora seminiperda CCB06 TaxID=1302712 RepID=A0A3M7M6L8_9PLEO|nr:Zinc finger CCCH-type [Pyrenophora seminiperda CCB06]
MIRPTTNGISSGSTSHLLPPRPAHSARPPTSPIPPTQRPYSAKSSSSSGIDPVLLEKSEHLVKAEQQLKRQQIERALKDQFDKKGRGNDAEEREALIDVEQCLIKAHQLVPPVSGLPSTTNNSDGAESFDENSYYSSKADSWSPERLDPADHSHTDAGAALTSQAKQTAQQVNVHAHAPEPTVIDLDEEAYEPADDIEIYEPPEPVPLLEEGEEEDYSPPPADIVHSEPSRGRARNRHGGTNGPPGPAAPVQNPRKRRRDEKQRERDEKRRQQQANKRTIPSPEPYIKEEPQSPPPFAGYPDSQPSKRRALQPHPDEVELVSAQGSPMIQPVYYRDQEPLSRSYREIDEPASPTVIRTPQRKSLRDDQDLRRVASLQYARRPYSPSGGGELYAAPEPRQIRAASHAFLDRVEAPIYREVSAHPSAAPRYVRDRSRSPVHEYLAHKLSPMRMAPPPRRIVVDQYGNQYYAAPVEVRGSMAPPSKRAEGDPFYERAVTREPTIRAPGRTEMYEEGAMQRMPMPMPPPPRRYVEAADAEMMESPYRRREACRRPVEVEYRAIPPYEEMGPPREYQPARSYSMRPEVVRREIPEGYIRHESIQPPVVRASQPRYREVSVVHQEPFDDGRYISAPQGRRYVEEGRMEVAPEAYAGEPRHVYTRY